MKIQALPCPKCNQEIAGVNLYINTNKFAVECKKCHLTTSEEFDTPAEALMAWNYAVSIFDEDAVGADEDG